MSLTRFGKQEKLAKPTFLPGKPSMTLAIVDEPSRHRFVANVEGQDCVLEYRLSGSEMTITHTGVPASLGGRGLAAELTRFALATARGKGWKVVPACSYSVAYFEKHPEERDLLVQGGSDQAAPG